MPRRRREDKRRVKHVPLDVLAALSAADVSGCAAIPESMTLDELYSVWASVDLPAGDTWAHRAFVQGVERPCDGLKVAGDGWDEGRTLTCSEDVCRFARKVDR